MESSRFGLKSKNEIVKNVSNRMTKIVDNSQLLSYLKKSLFLGIENKRPLEIDNMRINLFENDEKLRHGSDPQFVQIMHRRLKNGP